ncbi:YidH family protein [Desertivirga arenae]|uniref:YidH family protein n=1 Tax=Desertivirga arenae TaxID=2810309 RepID=UPI001A962CAA|nr:DUF202 domain-containing protein [Pedobacter sp. SYSU D00823]
MTENNTTERKATASDHLANERTFLAWIRTSIAIMGFGFVVVKFSLFIKQISFAFDEHIPGQGKGYSAIIGIILVATGALMTLLAFLRYRSIERKLLANVYYPSFKLSLVLTIALLLVSILLVVYLIPNI